MAATNLSRPAVYELLIEPVPHPKEKIFPPFPFKIKRPVNMSTFALYLKITNRSSKTFPGGWIRDVKIFESSSRYVESRPDKELPSIEPDQSVEITLDEELVLAMSGVYWVEGKPESKDGLAIETKQKLLSGKIGRGEPSGKPGYWRNPMVVDDIFQLHQRRINYTLAILTALVAFFTVLVYFKS
jgi:hypothetical protein